MQSSGVVVALASALVLIGWASRNATLVQIRPDFTAMVVATALSFLLAGLALAAPARQGAAWRRYGGAVIILVALLELIQHFAGVSIGLDLPPVHAWLADGNSRPGRMAPNTALGLLLTGAVLLMTDRIQSRLAAGLVQGATFGVLLLGLTGLVGYSLQLDLIYPSFTATRMSIPTAILMIVVGFALWSSWSESAWLKTQMIYREDEKIVIVGAAILIIVAITAGVAGLASQQSLLRESLAKVLPEERVRRAHAIELEIDGKVAVTRTLSELAPWDDLSAALAARPDKAAEATARFTRVVFDSGATGVAVSDASGNLVWQDGTLSAAPALEVGWVRGSGTTLLWDEMYRAKTRTPLLRAGKEVGLLTLEYPLTRLNHAMMDGTSLGATGEVGLCVSSGAQMRCFPQFRNAQVYASGRLTRAGTHTPMSRALSGPAGVLMGLDYRGNQVIAAYGAVAASNLGLVVKRNTSEIYAPIRHQLNWSIPLLLLLVVAGVFALRHKMSPLARRLQHSEQRPSRTNSASAPWSRAWAKPLSPSARQE